MSTTITQTAPVEQVREIVLQSLSTRVSGQVKALLAKMKEPYFHEEELTHWFSQFQKHNLTNEQGKLDASLDLCRLLFDVVTPVLQVAKGLPHFLKEIKTILALTMPQGMHVDQFMNDYIAYADEADQLHEEEQMQSQMEQEMIQEIYTLANAKNAEIVRSHKDDKARLSKIVDDQKSQSKALYDEIDQAAQKQSDAATALVSTAASMKAVSGKISAQEKEFEQLLQQCEDAFRNV